MLLYSGPLSLFSRKVEIALHEKGLPFERVMVPFTQAAGYAPKHPAVLAANPKGQVPVLVDGPTSPSSIPRSFWNISRTLIRRRRSIPPAPRSGRAAASSSSPPTRSCCRRCAR